MKIWIDADSCPGPVRDIVVRAATRRTIQTLFVANKSLALPASPYLTLVQVSRSADAADAYIKEHAESIDLVVTQDIPLAAALVAAGVCVINPRGEKYTEDNVLERLSLRNFMQDLRDSGEVTGGPKQFNDSDRRAFAARLDRELTSLLRAQSTRQN